MENTQTWYYNQVNAGALQKHNIIGGDISTKYKAEMLEVLAQYPEYFFVNKDKSEWLGLAAHAELLPRRRFAVSEYRPTSLGEVYVPNKGGNGLLFQGLSGD